MRMIRVCNFDRWQHYKDRSPPWIKLHRDILNDYKFSCLQDASKAHLMLIWLLAAQMDNAIPADSRWVSQRIGVSGDVDLELLQSLNFIEIFEDDSKVLADCYQSAMRETETETENKKTCIKSSGKKYANGADFERFWIAWPDKRNKKKARDVFIRKKFSITDVDELIADVELRKRSDKRWLGGFIPHCSTYLNGERWEDEYGR